jgi:WD40 repeat protein
MSVAAVGLDSPYKGLRPFEATAVDARLFFGRARERELIAANLVAARLTVLYGESGVGKSSVLRAGVVQTLREQARQGAGFAVALYTGWSEADPIEGIADAVRAAVADVLGEDPGAGSGTLAERLAAWAELVAGDVYLVLDQVDEYFLYHGWHGGPLLDVLPELVTTPGLPVNTLLGIREDALARLDVFKAAIPGLFANSLRLERLDAEAGRAAIVGPLGRWRELEGEQVEIENAVVDAILASVTVPPVEGNGASAAIEPPYLQIVMERLWEAEREAGSHVLRLETLERLGGGRRIVSEHLDRALGGLSAAEQDTAAVMFSQLVTPTGAKVAYDLADLAGYAATDEADVGQVADALMAERILRPVSGRGEGRRVEIYHDVLAAAAAEWRRRHDAERTLRQEREAARLRHRRLLVVAIVALVALALMTAVAVYAVAQQHEANTQRAHAASEAQAANAREDAASALLLRPTDPIGALALAADAAAADPSPRTEDVLRTTLVDARLRAVFGTRQAAVRTGAFSPNGRLVAVGDASGRIAIGPPLGKRRVVTYQRPGVNVVAFAGNRRLVTGGRDGKAAVRDVSSGSALRTLAAGGPVTALAVSRDGTVLVTGSAHGDVRVWSLPAGRLRASARLGGSVKKLGLTDAADRVLAVGGGHARLFGAATGAQLASYDGLGPVRTAALKPDGRLVATGYAGQHPDVALWRSGGALVTKLRGHRGGINDLEFEPYGPLLVSASSDGTGRVYNVDVGSARQFIAPLIGHSNTVVAASFSPRGTYVVTASTDKTAAVWQPEGNLLMTLVGHHDAVLGAALSPDDHWALTWSKDGAAGVWDWQPVPFVSGVRRLAAAPAKVAFAVGARVTAAIDEAGRVRVEGPGGSVRPLVHPGGASAVAIAPAGTTVATGGRDGTVLVWLGRETKPVRLELGAAVRALAFSGDGRTLAAAGRGGRARVWSMDGRQLSELPPSSRTFTAAALDDDGRTLALGDGRGLVTLWNARTGDLRGRLKGHTNDITALAFSPDGQLLVSGSVDHDARIWRVSDGRRLHLLRRHFSRVSDVSFSPDGRWVVTTGPQRVTLWATATGTEVMVLRSPHPKIFFNAATFSPNSRTIVTVDDAGTVARYRCLVCGRIGELRALAASRLTAVR